MFKEFFLFVAAVSLACPVAAAQQAQTADSAVVALRAVDGQVATIGHRLAVASADLCRERAWLPGFTLHDLSQYGGASRDAAIREFGLDRGPGVLAIAAGGPAARAGLRTDDIVLAADGVALAADGTPAGRTFSQVERMLDKLDAAFADGSADLVVLRGTQRLVIHVAADQGCPSRFQLIPSRQLNAHADGRYVQVTTAIAQYSQDEAELAAVLAHEFAHNVLHHRTELDAAHVSRGFMGNFGRNARLIRDTEAEADRLSVYLLDRAGFDPQAAVRFWERFGRRGLNLLGSPTHPNWRQRIALFQAEIANIGRSRAAGRIPVPPFLDAGPARPSAAAPSG